MTEYQIVKPYRDLTDPPGRFVLDSNVAIDIEDFYYGRPRAKRILPDLREILIQLAGDTRAHQNAPDINYSLAILEACSTRTSPVDIYRERSLRRALTVVLGWSREELLSNFSNRHPPANRDKLLKAGLPIPPEDSAGRHPGGTLAARYGAILFLCYLDQTRPAGRRFDRAEALERFIEWMTFQLGVRSAYETQLAIDLFLGSRDRMNGARRLLKLSGTENPNALADRAWNAAWDLEFLGLTERWSFGLEGSLVPGGTLTFLLTRNTDPAFIRFQSELTGINSWERVSLPALGLGWDEREDVDDSRILEIIQAGLSEADLCLRMAAEPAAVRARATKAISRLEDELGASHANLDNMD